MPRVFAAAALILLALSASKLPGQDKATLRITFRVTAVRPQGRLVIDRGSNDRIAAGDLVMLLPRNGRRLPAKVLRVDMRSGVVELENSQQAVVPGTRGEARVPASRFAGPAQNSKQAKPPKHSKTALEPSSETRRSKPSWANKDKKWRPGMPLLAKARPVRPENRAWKMSGRFYTTGSLSHTPNNGSSNSYLRSGADLLYDNLFSKGGQLRVAAEFNAKAQQSNNQRADVLFRRLSYTQGGTRFAPERIDAGRFLQYEMPEFGVLDGVAWSRRLANGDRFGASIGFQPEPTNDYDSFKDFQFAGFYKWVTDESEALSASIGYQKSFHHGHSDRDLVVAKFQSLPEEGWDLQGSAWIDLYTGNDPAQKTPIELTQALFSAGRRDDDGSGFDISLWHQMFPDVLRRQNRYIPITRLRSDRHDRLTFQTWKMSSEWTRLHATLVGWNDENESGASIEAGFEQRELIFEDGRSDLTVFASQAQFEAAFGLRALTGRDTSLGRWDASYELSYHHRVAFPANFADIIQQRVFGEHEFTLDGGWDLSAWADANLYDSDFSLAIGFYLQKHF